LSAGNSAQGKQENEKEDENSAEQTYLSLTGVIHVSSNLNGFYPFTYICTTDTLV
jgi:hypothetical protein